MALLHPPCLVSFSGLTTIKPFGEALRVKKEISKSIFSIKKAFQIMVEKPLIMHEMTMDVIKDILHVLKVRGQ